MKLIFRSFLCLVAFCASFASQVWSQQVDDYRYYSWSALNEDWDVQGALITSQPTTGTAFHDAQGNLVYQNTDSSSPTDSFEVMMTAQDLIAAINVSVDKLSGAMVYKFNGINTKPRDNSGASSGTGGGTVGSTTTLPGSTVTGTVVGLPGTNAPIPVGGTVEVFVTDTTVPGDSWDIWWDLGGCGIYHDGVKDWTDIRDDLFPLSQNSVDVLVFSGHGSIGGVQSSGGDITEATLTDSAREVLKSRTSPGGVVVICGCSQGSGGYVEGIQDLANELGLPIIVNTGAVSSGTYGAGTWVQIDPTPQSPPLPPTTPPANPPSTSGNN